MDEQQLKTKLHTHLIIRIGTLIEECIANVTNLALTFAHHSIITDEVGDIAEIIGEAATKLEQYKQRLQPGKCMECDMPFFNRQFEPFCSESCRRSFLFTLSHYKLTHVRARVPTPAPHHPKAKEHEKEKPKMKDLVTTLNYNDVKIVVYITPKEEWLPRKELPFSFELHYTTQDSTQPHVSSFSSYISYQEAVDAAYTAVDWLTYAAIHDSKK